MEIKETDLDKEYIDLKKGVEKTEKALEKSPSSDFREDEHSKAQSALNDFEKENPDVKEKFEEKEKEYSSLKEGVEKTGEALEKSPSSDFREDEHSKAQSALNDFEKENPSFTDFKKDEELNSVVTKNDKETETNTILDSENNVSQDATVQDDKSSDFYQMIDDLHDKAVDAVDNKVADIVDKAKDALETAMTADVTNLTNDVVKPEVETEVKPDVEPTKDSDVQQDPKIAEMDEDLKSDIKARKDDMVDLNMTIDEAKNTGSGITDEMRDEQKKTEAVVKDAMENYNNASDDLAQADKGIREEKENLTSIEKEEVIKQYSKEKISGMADDMGLEGKTKDAFVDFTYEQNKESFQKAESDTDLDNKLGKVETNAKQDFENYLDKKEEALNDLKDDKDVNQDALKKEFDETKDMQHDMQLSQVHVDSGIGKEDEVKDFDINSQARQELEKEEMKGSERREDFDSSIDVPEKEQNQGQEQGMSR